MEEMICIKNIIDALRIRVLNFSFTIILLLVSSSIYAQIDRVIIGMDEYGLTEMVLWYDAVHDTSWSELEEYLDITNDNKLSIKILASTTIEELYRIIKRINSYLENKRLCNRNSFTLQFIIVDGEQKDYIYPPPPPPLIQDSIRHERLGGGNTLLHHQK